MLLYNVNTAKHTTGIIKKPNNKSRVYKLDKIQNLFDINYVKLTKDNTSSEDKPLISYIININVSNSNIAMSINDKNGKLKGYFTAGTLGFKGSQKTKKYTLITILKNFNYKFNFLNNKSVLVNFKGVTKDQKLFIKKLKEKVSIKAINYTNLLPHNGCRPRKIKKSKR